MSQKTKIAFTSCMRYQAYPVQPQWLSIEAENPDYLFLLGDQIYMDFGIIGDTKNGAPECFSDGKFESEMNRHYENQWNEPNFKKLFGKMKAKSAVFGIWDDHDFAWNNAFGNSVCESKKIISRRMFHQWMGCSTNLPEIYCHIDIPHARVIFLDTRYYADSPGTSPRKLLGSKQFDFLEQSLNHNSQYTIICSGITLTHGSENWTRFDHDYNRLKALLDDVENVLFLAGDIHANRYSPPDSSRPCHEIVSSGLAINKLGLPFTGRHNWGILELDENEVLINLVDMKKQQRFHIHTGTAELRKN
ncbi:alkaline phosphatase family protein [Granulosicoccus sp.]|nr:alkaline phosphatase D family protein [Granulosicoccus sp.]MDB4223347.1 alkaline phosphatase family protein [Granulosicoccus sp.]